MNGIRAYQDTTVTTQSKGRLIVMLYEGAVKFLKLAIRDAEAKDYEGKGNHINKARDIINELNAVQGSPQDIVGYYFPDPELAAKAVRPSNTLNSIIKT